MKHSPRYPLVLFTLLVLSLSLTNPLQAQKTISPRPTTIFATAVPTITPPALSTAIPQPTASLGTAVPPVVVSTTQNADEVPGGFSLFSFFLGVGATLFGGIITLGTVSKTIMGSPALLKVIEGLAKNVPPEFAAKAIDASQNLRDVADLTKEVFDGVDADSKGNG